MGAAAILPAASLALSAVGTGASVLGGMGAQSAAAGQAQQQQAWGVYQSQQQAAASSAQAAWERSLAQQRKTIAEGQVTDSLQRGQVAEDVSRLTTAQIAGKQRAGLAAQGTDLAGSPTAILGDTAAAGEFDARTIRANATREAYGHKLELVNATNDENLAQAKQDNAKPGMVINSYTPSNFGAAGSLLSGASNLAERWWRFQQVSPGGTGAGAYTPYYSGPGAMVT